MGIKLGRSGILRTLERGRSIQRFGSVLLVAAAGTIVATLRRTPTACSALVSKRSRLLRPEHSNSAALCRSACYPSV